VPAQTLTQNYPKNLCWCAQLFVFSLSLHRFSHTTQEWTVIRYYIREKRRLIEVQEPEPGCWINLAPPFGPDELDDFARQMAFDPVFLTDSLDLDERARYERDEDIRFILINTPVLNKELQEEGNNEAIYITVPIGIILTIEHVITVSAIETSVIETFLENKVRNFDPADEKRFVLQILEQNVYRFLSCLKNRAGTDEQQP
jgi:magnesium transporter